MCFNIVDGSLHPQYSGQLHRIYMRRVNHRTLVRLSLSFVEHSRAREQIRTLIRWLCDEHLGSMSTNRCWQLIYGSNLLSHGRPSLTSSLPSKTITIKSKLYSSSFNVFCIPVISFFTVTNMPVARRTVTLVREISRLTYYKITILQRLALNTFVRLPTINEGLTW